MGYSCDMKAMNVLDSLSRYNRSIRYPSNAWWYRDKYYIYEIGKENYDGSITGSVYSFKSESGVGGRKAGTFRIEPDGHVTRGAGGLKTILDILKEPFVEIADWKKWDL